MNNIATLSFYDRLGGDITFQSLVTVFYDSVLADERVSFFFDHVDRDRLEKHFRAFIKIVLKNDQHVDLQMLRDKHAPLVERMGLNEQHFGIVAAHFNELLEIIDMNAGDINKIMSQLASLMPVILNRPITH